MGPIVKYGFRSETIQVLDVSPDALDQGFTIHVIAEFGEKEADLFESLFWPLGLFFPERVAAQNSRQSQKKKSEDKNMEYPFHRTP
jgi:hypothetical protein